MPSSSNDASPKDDVVLETEVVQDDEVENRRNEFAITSGCSHISL
jgi:hypothetical protein